MQPWEVAGLWWGRPVGSGDPKVRLRLWKVQPAFLRPHWGRGVMLGVDLTGPDGEHQRQSWGTEEWRFLLLRFWLSGRELGWPIVTKTECLTSHGGEAQSHSSFGLDKTMQNKIWNESCTECCQFNLSSLMITSKNKLAELFPRPETNTGRTPQPWAFSYLPSHLTSWVLWCSWEPGSVLRCGSPCLVTSSGL